MTQKLTTLEFITKSKKAHLPIEYDYSFADRRFGEGNVYKQLGFVFSHNSVPNYHYFKKGQINLRSRVSFQKHKLEKKLDIFNPLLSEWENMVNNGYDRIWDCGNAVWEMFMTQ